ncbi:MAG: TRAP transporter large permease [Candidatus Ratteibacteria bacterium]
MNEVLFGIIGLCTALLLFLTGIELGFAMAIVGFLGFSLLRSFEAGLNMVAKDLFDVFSSYSFTVIPLFVLMGQIAFNAGIARRLYKAAYRFFGHIPGGLAVATVAGATIFKAICGSSPATAATFASVAVPEMDRYGYAKKLSTGIVATVGTLGILIPPSVTLIIFGVITSQSIGKLFLAGFFPGLIIAFLFIVIIIGWCKIDPSLGPHGERSTWQERFKTLPEVFFVGIVFLLVIGGMMKGFFSPTEAGSVGCLAVLLLAIGERAFSFRKFFTSLDESIKIACMVLMLIAGSTILGHFLAVTRIPMIAAEWVANLPLHRYLIMTIIAFIYLIGGSFIDDLAFMVLATPIFYPVVLKLNFDPIWFGILIGITVMIGVVIPPVAMNVFIVKKITKTPLSVIYSGVYPFLLSLILCAILLFIFPQIATFLPSVLMR